MDDIKQRVENLREWLSQANERTRKAKQRIAELQHRLDEAEQELERYRAIPIDRFWLTEQARVDMYWKIREIREPELNTAREVK